jgi:outer membrane protein OmpA-like peptidoglycan-associated protein
LLLTEGQTEILEAKGTVKDTTGRSVSSSDVVIIAPRVKSRSEVRTTVTPQRLDGEPILLGHFAFDGTSFITTNDAGVEVVRKALKDGKKVSLLASADNCGLAEYNQELVQRRARAALELLGVREQDVFISTMCTTADANTTPMDRISNRSVRAIIR